MPQLALVPDPQRSLDPEPSTPTPPDPPLADWPLDLRAGAFAPLALPWLADSCVPFAAPAPRHDYAVGDAVRLLELPRALADIPRAARRRLGRMVGELYEVFALPLPDQLMIARRVGTSGGGQGLQILYVSPNCVERAVFAAAPPAAD